MPNIYPNSLTDNIRFWTKIKFYLNNTNFLFNEKLSELLQNTGGGLEPLQVPQSIHGGALVRVQEVKPQKHFGMII